jgi:hypothetical protein
MPETPTPRGPAPDEAVFEARSARARFGASRPVVLFFKSSLKKIQPLLGICFKNTGNLLLAKDHRL